MIETVSCWLAVVLNWFLVYCVVVASQGASNSRSDSLVVSSRVEQASKPTCLEYRVIVECSPLAVIVLETGYIESRHIEYSLLLVIRVVSAL